MRIAFCLTAAALALAVASPARADGDVEKGKQSFNKCKACHSLDEGKNMIGPSLHGLIGRKSATVPKFSYSKAMESANVTWDEPTLRKYLHNPKAMVPGTKMIFAGITKESELDDLLAYLNKAAKGD